MNIKRNVGCFFYSISASKSNRRALFPLMISERMLWISMYLYKRVILSIRGGIAPFLNDWLMSHDSLDRDHCFPFPVDVSAGPSEAARSGRGGPSVYLPNYCQIELFLHFREGLPSRPGL